MMGLTQLANLGEFIGGVAVLVTLVYLVVQIRQNNENARAASRQALLTGVHGANFEVARDPELIRIIGSGLADFDALSGNERARFVFTVDQYLGNVENGLLLYQQGILDLKTLEGVVAQLAAALKCPGGAAYWRTIYLAPEVRAFVDAFLDANRESLPSMSEIIPGWVALSATSGPESS